MAKLSPIFNEAQFILGIPAVGGKLFTYAAGSTTPQPTFTDASGATPQSNPITLDARGEPSSPIWLAEGLAYKLVFTSSTDTDPPTSPIRTIDNVTGIGDNTVTVSQWQDTGIVPTYVNSTTFTVPGDQTSTFFTGRRVQAFVTAGTVYGYVTNSSFTTLTTITLDIDSGSLDSGLSSVKIGLLTPDNHSIPLLTDFYPIVSNSADKTKKIAFNLSSITTGLKRVFTWPDRDGTVALAADLDNKQVSGIYRTLKASAPGTSAIVTIIIAEIITGDGTGKYLSTRNWNNTITMTTSGAGGLDTGSVAASTWYYMYAITKDDGTKACIASLSSTSPLLPTDYTKWARIGAFFTDATVNRYPFSFIQYNNKVRYVTKAGSNVTTPRVLASGVAGTISASVFTPVAVSIANFVPPTAISIDIGLGGTTSSQAMAAPSTEFSGWATTNPPPAGINVNSMPFTLVATIFLETYGLFWGSNHAGNALNVYGWEDNF
jgi:hypothetical protein